MSRWLFQRNIVARARAIPQGAWDYVQQFEVRHVLSDLLDAYIKLREELRELKKSKDA